MIPQETYKQIIEHVPIICVDVIVKDKKGNVLLVKRANKPLQGEWWVIGGRVKKGEQLKDAAKRKVFEEVGLKIQKLEPLGYYEEFYTESPFDVPIHTMSFVFSSLARMGKIRLDNQSSEYAWFRSLPNRFTKNFTKANGRK